MGDSTSKSHMLASKQPEECGGDCLGPGSRWRLTLAWSWGVLTGDGAEVQVVPDDLLQLVVHRALLEAQAEVAAQVLVQHAPCRHTEGHS